MIPEVIKDLKGITHFDINVKMSKSNRPSGIYFAFQNDILIYIGRSTDIRARIYQHRMKSKFNIDSVFYVPFEFMNDQKVAERFYIHKYKPKYNKMAVVIDYTESSIESNNNKIMEKLVRPGITLYPRTIRKAKKAAEKLGLSFSAYISKLILEHQ